MQSASFDDSVTRLSINQVKITLIIVYMESKNCKKGKNLNKTCKKYDSKRIQIFKKNDWNSKSQYYLVHATNKQSITTKIKQEPNELNKKLRRHIVEDTEYNDDLLRDFLVLVFVKLASINNFAIMILCYFSPSRSYFFVGWIAYKQTKM